MSVLVLSLAGCAASVQVQQSAPPAPTVARTGGEARVAATARGSARADGHKIRCIDEVATGSRIPQRVCRTVAEWKLIEEQSKDQARQFQGPRYGTDQGGPPI